jgi:hypothetical protein
MPLLSVDLLPSIATAGIASDGALQNRSQALVGAALGSSFGTFLAPALSLLPAEHLALDTYDIIQAKVEAGAIAGSDHPKHELETDAPALAHLTDWSARAGAEATASVGVKLASPDGTLPPMKSVTPVSLPALPAVPALHTLGPLSIDGSPIAGVRSVSYRSGFACTISPASDGDLYGTAIVPGAPRAATLTIEHQDPLALQAAIGFAGKKVAVSVGLLALASGVPLASGQITATCAHAIAGLGGIRPPQGAQTTGSITFNLTSADGIAAPLVYTGV